MSLSEEKEIKAATDSFGEAVVVFNHKDYKKALALFSEINKSYCDSEYFTVLEIVGKARSYASMAEQQLRTESEKPEDREDFISAALINLNSGRLPEAMELLQQCQTKFGPNAKVHYIRSLVFARQGHDDQAIAELGASINIDKNLKTFAYNEPDFERLIDNQAFRSLTT